MNMGKGIPWTHNKVLEDLDFADDLCLLAKSAADIQEKLSRLATQAQKVGLKINTGKTKQMQIKDQRPTSLLLDGEPIETVDQFCYLGSKISPDGGTDLDIESRINKARGAFITMRPIWLSQ